MRRPPHDLRSETPAEHARVGPRSPWRRAGPWVGLASGVGLGLVVLTLLTPVPAATASAGASGLVGPPHAPNHAPNHTPAALSAPAAVPPAKWALLSPAVSPAPRQSGSMVYDPVAREFVLFGGYSAGTPLGDTWTFSAGAWTNRTSTTLSQPSARWYYGMTWDPADGAVLLFGGRNAANDLNDTWEFTGSAWSQVATATAPPPMTTSRLIYDAQDGRVVLYGGDSIMAGTPSFYNVVWTFHHGTWKNITASVAGLPANPNPLTDGVYDAASGAIVYFGGDTSTGRGCAAPGYTWTFSNGTFTNVSRAPGTAPPLALGSRMMAYDPAVQAVVLYGGWDGGSCSFSRATYEYHAGTWSKVLLAGGPGPLWDGDMATDSTTGQALLFSGNTVPYTNLQSDATWRFTP